MACDRLHEKSKLRGWGVADCHWEKSDHFAPACFVDCLGYMFDIRIVDCDTDFKLSGQDFLSSGVQLTACN